MRTLKPDQRHRKLLAIGLLLLIVGLIGVWATKLGPGHLKPKLSQTTPPPAKTDFYKLVDACTVFSLADAQALAGPSQAPIQNAPALSFSDMQESSCTYQDNPANPAQQRGLSLTIRSPRNAAGQARNQQQFLAVPAGKQLLSSLGDQAYWDTNTRQLNVLKNNYWLIFISDPRVYNRNLADAQAMADIILPKINQP